MTCKHLMGNLNWWK